MTRKAVYLREEWARWAEKSCGGVVGFATRVGVDKGTASRQLKRQAVSSGTFIAAVIVAFDVSFEDAFELADRTDVLRAQLEDAESAERGGQIVVSA